MFLNLGNSFSIENYDGNDLHITQITYIKNFMNFEIKMIIGIAPLNQIHVEILEKLIVLQILYVIIKKMIKENRNAVPNLIPKNQIL